MKFIDINREFTAAANSYMAQGYYINAGTMGGSQGEVAHIDLTDGKQIVRVLLDSFTEWEDYNQLEGLKLVVGIAADNVKPNDNQRRDVIWNNRLEVISCEKFYKLSSNRDDSVFYGTREKATAAPSRPDRQPGEVPGTRLSGKWKRGRGQPFLSGCGPGR